MASTINNIPDTKDGQLPAFSPNSGQEIFNALPVGLLVFDNQLRILWWNAAAAFLVDGVSTLAAALKNGTMESAYQDWEAILYGILRTKKHQRFEHVVYFIKNDRRDRPDTKAFQRILNLDCIAFDEFGNDEKGNGILIIEDVTALADMAKKLAISERMAAVGKLAARVAHELNNPLDGILRYVNLSMRAIEANTTDKLTDYLERARNGLGRMATIIRELVDFSRTAHTNYEETGINAIVEEAVKVMSEKAMLGGVSIICNLEEGLPLLHGTSMFQVFCNMIKNAVDAMPDGGTLTIITRKLPHDVVIRFEDTGIGLPEDINNLFEPFFTTKETGKGTGLGLAISREIVEKYNGRITPERRPCGGAAFTIQIPLDHCGHTSPTTLPTASLLQNGPPWTISPKVQPK